MLPAKCSKGFVGALDDALRSDIDPATGGHLAVHREFKGFQAVEFITCGPFRYQIGVRDQDAWRMRKGSESADRLAGLNEQGFVVLKVFQTADNVMKSLPAAGGAAGSTVDDQIARIFGNFFIEIIH